MDQNLLCPLCVQAGGQELWQDDQLRVIVADEPDYPGFLRVVWHRHVAEWSDLSDAERRHLDHCLLQVERAIRDCMQPDKINLASLGNVVPHLHWHVIPRFADDPHFPQPVWGQRQRDVALPEHAVRQGRALVLQQHLQQVLAGQ
jgi:diadenosine tetraphosphate (Ap4A) HIT family hydrolase